VKHIRNFLITVASLVCAFVLSLLFQYTFEVQEHITTVFVFAVFFVSLKTVIVWASVLISAFIDNIPYVATMIPVIAGLATALEIDPTVLYFGLLSGATLGGNCTPIGASANIAGIGILRKEGYTVKNSDFFKIGIPFTISAIVPAYVYLWLMYGM